MPHRYVHKYVLIVFTPQLSRFPPTAASPSSQRVLYFHSFISFSYFSCFFSSSSLLLFILLFWWPQCILTYPGLTGWRSFTKVWSQTVAIPLKKRSSSPSNHEQLPVRHSGKDGISWGNTYLSRQGLHSQLRRSLLSVNINVWRPRKASSHPQNSIPPHSTLRLSHSFLLLFNDVSWVSSLYTSWSFWVSANTPS